MTSWHWHTLSYGFKRNTIYDLKAQIKKVKRLQLCVTTTTVKFMNHVYFLKLNNVELNASTKMSKYKVMIAGFKQICLPSTAILSTAILFVVLLKKK